MMRADHLIHGEIAEPQPSPGFLLAPFGWAAEPVAAMMRADRSLFADLFAIDRSRMHLIALQWRASQSASAARNRSIAGARLGAPSSQSGLGSTSGRSQAGVESSAGCSARSMDED